MTSFKTNKGATYCATVPTSGTVQASYIKDGAIYTVTLVSAEEPGQYYFCAPTWSVQCSEDSINITPVVGGSAGVGSGSGGGSGSTDGFIPEEGTNINE